MTQTNKCKDCKFYSVLEQRVMLLGTILPNIEYTQIDHTCRRYPTHVKVSEDHWCGDYAPK
jgi:hypothetical protein